MACVSCRPTPLQPMQPTQPLCILTLPAIHLHMRASMSASTHAAVETDKHKRLTPSHVGFLPVPCAATCTPHPTTHPIIQPKRELGRLLRVNIMAYDYTGYGASRGQPSIAATCGDVSAVLSSLEAHHNVKQSQVVLYGQSVGSGPTVRMPGGVGDRVVPQPPQRLGRAMR